MTYRYDGDAFVAERADLVERNIRDLSRLDGADGRGLLDRRVRMDANLTAFLARALVFERGRIEATIYERLRAAEFVPVETAHPRGARSYSAQTMNHVGKAKISHDLAGDDPRVDVELAEDLRKYVNVRASYAYSVQELEEAAFAGIALPSWKGDACADVIARGLDEIGRSGNALAGLTGFFNNGDVPTLTLTNGEWSSTATADEIVADLQEIEATIIAQTKDTQALFGPYVLVLPTAMEGRIRTMARNASSDMTIAEWFLKNSRVIKRIERYSALDSATGADIAVADAPQGIVYPATPSVLFWPMPITYEEQSPQLSGWEWVVRARARCGGVDFRRPTHCLYVDNLD